MDNSKLDILLDELKQKNTSVNFEEFCMRTWGASNETFKNCRLFVQTLVDDGYATYTPNSNKLILLTGKGERFKGYVQTEIDNKLEIDEENENKKLKKQNLKLSNDEMEYKKTIRKLEEELKISSLLKNWWGLILAAIALGIAIGKILI